MALWSNKDEEAGKPKYLTTAEKSATYGIADDEVTAGVTHSGWVLKTEGSGGRAGRTFYETLVAMGSMSRDGTTSITTKNRTLTISAQPANTSVANNATATFSVTASVSPADSATLGYQWQRSTDGGSSWTNITGATSATYSFTALTAMNTYKYQVIVSADGAVSVTSDPATLTVA